MQLQELTYLLQYPETISDAQTEFIKKAVEDYPYFQPARAIYLKGLKNKESYKYNNALKVTAAYTADRSILFDYITSEEFNQNAISETIKQNSEYLKSIVVNDVNDISINKSVTIDDALNKHIKDTERVLDPRLFEEKQSDTAKESVETQIQEHQEAKKPEEQLKIGKPLEFTNTETHSFSEWLKITSFKPIDRGTPETKEPQPSAPLDQKIEIIDRFLENNPKIKPTVNQPKPKLVNNEPTEESLMTETLARIYLEQKNYEKAIQSYKILSLKYPEKSSFFADQIKAVKELKDNNQEQ
ncbi:hypothetical protein [Winogradskyella sp. A3E31]|uniref:hypothetical protein n=1 Tax=Winogradskyella sp. A3E31 TaxID=3349637 RepID=UPI00398B39F0